MQRGSRGTRGSSPAHIVKTGAEASQHTTSMQNAFAFAFKRAADRRAGLALSKPQPLNYSAPQHVGLKPKRATPTGQINKM
ncbi:MAG: hypothetical protein [Microviridae sp.]|nr:MAG: hypothetical protein [Microviridae sp.]